MNERLRKLGLHPLAELAQQRRELAARGVRAFDFGAGDASEPVAEPIRAALLAAVPPVSVHPSVEGPPELRAAIAGYLRRRFGVEVDAAREVLPTMGSREALFHLPMVRVQVPSDKDLVLYGEPANPVYEVAALFAEAWTYAVPLGAGDRYVFDPDLVPEAVLRRAAVVFLNTPHVPSGQCLPESVLRAWVAARDQFGFTLVSDESHADLWFGAARPHSLLEFGRRGCLAVHSLSHRSGMAGYRSGFVAGDGDRLADYARYRFAMGVAAPEFVQAAATVAWSDDAHVDARRRAFGEKRRILLDLFARLRLRVLPSEASTYLWVEVPAGSTGRAYAERCRTHGILVAPGECFGPGQERWCRVALLPSRADCEAAARVWPA